MKNWKQFRKNSYMTDEIGLKCATDVLKHIYYLKGNIINFVSHAVTVSLKILYPNMYSKYKQTNINKTIIIHGIL